MPSHVVEVRAEAMDRFRRDIERRASGHVVGRSVHELVQDGHRQHHQQLAGAHRGLLGGHPAAAARGFRTPAPAPSRAGADAGADLAAPSWTSPRRAVRTARLASRAGRRHGRADQATGAAARRWQAIVLASSGDGQTRRRASDAVRLAGAVLLFAVSSRSIHFNPQAELRLAHLMNSPPDGIHWLITLAWLLGTVAVMAVAVVSGILTRRLALLRDVIVSGIVAWLACVAAGAVLGSTGGSPTRRRTSARSTLGSRACASP